MFSVMVVDYETQEEINLFDKGTVYEVVNTSFVTDPDTGKTQIVYAVSFVDQM
jgi:hypothetical protein